MLVGVRSLHMELLMVAISFLPGNFDKGRDVC
jgi:hypothetical protein